MSSDRSRDQTNDQPSPRRDPGMPDSSGAPHRPLLRCQCVALGAGLVVCRVLTVVPQIVQRTFGVFYWGASVVSVGVLLAAVTALCLPFVGAVAVYSGRHDKAAFLTAAVPAVFVLVASFVWEISFHYESQFDPGQWAASEITPWWRMGSQLRKILLILIWAGLSGGLGLGLKRLLIRAPKHHGSLSERTSRSFLIFCMIVVVAIGIGLGLYAIQTAKVYSPESKLAAARSILDAPASTLQQRAQALRDLEIIRTPESRALQQKAVTDQPYPLNILTALNLVLRNDLSALPVLEKELMQSGSLHWEFGHAYLWMALIGITDPAARPALNRLLQSNDPAVRKVAAEALQKIEQKHPSSP